MQYFIIISYVMSSENPGLNQIPGQIDIKNVLIELLAIFIPVKFYNNV